MPSRLNPYLLFDGNARQALEFYASVFGGTPAYNTFAEFGDADAPNADRIMHGVLETDAGYTIMVGDVADESDHQPMAGFAVSIGGDDGERLHGYWNRIADGGTVGKAMEKQVWGDEFGMCVDKFGVQWMINISAPSS